MTMLLAAGGELPAAVGEEEAPPRLACRPCRRGGSSSSTSRSRSLSSKLLRVGRASSRLSWLFCDMMAVGNEKRVQHVGCAREGVCQMSRGACCLYFANR